MVSTKPCVKGSSMIGGTEKGKAIPLQVWTGPYSSRMRFTDFRTIGT
jgi:hypothetical protein